MSEITEKALKRSQIMYIIQAALEYFISIMVTGSFLATITKELGFSDSLTGILSSLVSLGCLFQLFSLSIRKTKVKRFVIIFSIINQLIFMLLYVTPLLNIAKPIKIAVFIFFVLSAYLIYYMANPKKVNWLMSLIEDRHRGRFTANKEIISLATGIAFSFGMGALIDHFSEIGQIRIAFILSAIVIFALMVFHSIVLIFTVEKEAPPAPQKKIGQTLKELIKNKKLLHVTVILLLYYISTYISTPFYGTYIITELGLSLTFVSIITMCGSLSRISVSKFWGRYADKNSFASMIEKCFIILALSQICVIFASPKLGKIMFVLYYVFHGIAQGGINSALTNLIFDYVPAEKRADSLAITQALAGLTGFLTTLLISPLITSMQNNGNQIFGFSIYAQQFITIIALIFTVLTILYTRYFLLTKKR